MTFLALILGLLLLQLWGSDNPIQNDRWFADVQARIDQWLESPAARLAVVVLGPMVLAMLVLDVLRPLLFGLLWIAAAALLLLYSFGRGDYHARVARYTQACRQGVFEVPDDEAAVAASAAEQPIPEPIPELAPAISPAQMHAGNLGEMLYAGYQRWFPVLFYFLLLGPAAALAYRLLQLCRDSYAPRHAAAMLHVLDWVPARLLALVFALVGDFVRSGKALQQGFFSTTEPAQEVLLRVAVAAGAVPEVDTGEASYGIWAAEQVAATTALLSRSAVVWIVVVAVAEILL